MHLPDNLPESDAKYGLMIGPPLLEHLGLPLHVEINLHNELFNRGIFTLAIARKQRNDLVAALQKALAIDADKILEAYD